MAAYVVMVIGKFASPKAINTLNKTYRRYGTYGKN